MKNSWESQLQNDSICSFGTHSRFQDIFEKALFSNFQSKILWIKVDAFELFRLEFEQNHQLNAQLLIDADCHNSNEPPRTKKSKTDGSNLIGLFRQIYNEKRALIGHLIARLSMVTMEEKKMRWIFGLAGGECDDTIKNILSSLNDINQTSWCDYKAGIAFFY